MQYLRFIFFLIFMAISIGTILPHRHALRYCFSVRGDFHQMAQFLLIQKPTTIFPKFHREVISYSVRLIENSNTHIKYTYRIKSFSIK